MERIFFQRKRAELYRKIREFFTSRGYDEVFTPNLSFRIIPEETISCFNTHYRDPYGKNVLMTLLPSPEYYLKRLIGEGAGNIFEISRCYRNGEQLSPIHSVEFDMLEFYTMGFTADDSIDLTIELIRSTKISEAPWILKDPLIISVDEILKRELGVSLEDISSIEGVNNLAKRLGMTSFEGEAWEDTYNRIFLTFLEPALDKGRMVFLKDYPSRIKCLAKDKDPFTKERWELYVDGVEIANTYTEETDPKKIESFFLEEQRLLEESRKRDNGEVTLSDDEFPHLNMPECSGGALGLDRLLMAELGLESISPLLSAPLDDNLKR